MCVAAIAWDVNPDLLLVAIGNRDEFHERPSAPLARWEDGSGIIAGQDLRAGGTWLGISEAGRFALLTNFRDPEGLQPERASRGGLVTGMLAGSEVPELPSMNPFNLFYADRHGAKFMTNRPRSNLKPLERGIYGLSNGPFDQPWPKTQQLCAELDDWLMSDRSDIDALFEALHVESPKPVGPMPIDAPAPDFAPVFIRNATYGTRCSSVVVIGRDGAGIIAERGFDAQGNDAGFRQVEFTWPV